MRCPRRKTRRPTKNQKDLKTALNLLKELVMFTRAPDIQQAIDGVFDPYLEMAEDLLDRRCPGWDAPAELWLPA
jgi:hypothetical protein